MEFKASLGNWAKIITIAITLLFLFLVFDQYAFISNGNNKPDYIYTIAIIVIVFSVSYGFSVKYYSVTDDALIIHRPVYNVKIKKINIKSVAVLKDGSIGFAWRTFGNGGLFGYYGSFYNSKFGRMTWYRTRTDNTILVTTTSNRKIVLSPDEPDAFASALQKTISHPH